MQLGRAGDADEAALIANLMFRMEDPTGFTSYKGSRALR
jgi:hypothetical protein